MQVRVSEDPKAYYREYQRTYYARVRKHDHEYMAANAARSMHKYASGCPYPQMSAAEARSCCLRVVGSGWFWKAPPGTDSRDAAQDRALRELEAALGVAEAK